jgi:hypothetical protein
VPVAVVPLVVLPAVLPVVSAAGIGLVIST